MGNTLSLLSAALLLSTVKMNSGYDGSFPPWPVDETDLPTLYVPLIIPLSNHGCGPSRYQAIRMAVNDVNNRNDVICPAIKDLTTRFRIIYEIIDSAGNPDMAIEGLKEVVANMKANGRKVVVVLGPNNSGSAKAVSQYLAGEKVPLISWAATNSDLSNKELYEYFFRTVPAESKIMPALADFLDQLPHKKAHMIYFDGALPSGQAENFRTEASTRSIKLTEHRLTGGSSGTSLSPSNWNVMHEELKQIQRSPIKVIVAFAESEQAYDLWKSAHDLGMTPDQGWLWLGGDGINEKVIGGDSERVKYFAGSFFVQTKTPFQDLQRVWKERMDTTDTPEFHSMRNCSGDVRCGDSADFTGWVEGKHDEELVCRSYTAPAYDALVVIAKVFDGLLQKGASIDKENFMMGLQKLIFTKNAFRCASGVVGFDRNQDRTDLAMGVYNYQIGKLLPVNIGSWTDSDHLSWEVGQIVYWRHGHSHRIQSPDILPGIPSAIGYDEPAEESDPTGLSVPLIVPIVFASACCAGLCVFCLVVLARRNSGNTCEGLCKMFAVWRGNPSRMASASGGESPAERSPSHSSSTGVPSSSGNIIRRPLDDIEEMGDRRDADKPTDVEQDPFPIAPHISTLPGPIDLEEVKNTLANVAAGRTGRDGDVDHTIQSLEYVLQVLAQNPALCTGQSRTGNWQRNLILIAENNNGQIKHLALRCLQLLAENGDASQRLAIVEAIKSTLVVTNDDDWEDTARVACSLLKSRKCIQEEIKILTHGLIDALAYSRRATKAMDMFNDLIGPPNFIGQVTGEVVRQACFVATNATGLDSEPKLYIASMLGNWVAREKLEFQHKNIIKDKMLRYVKLALSDTSGPIQPEVISNVVELMSRVLQQQFDVNLEREVMLGRIEGMFKGFLSEDGQQSDELGQLGAQVREEKRPSRNVLQRGLDMVMSLFGLR